MLRTGAKHRRNQATSAIGLIRFWMYCRRFITGPRPRGRVAVPHTNHRVFRSGDITLNRVDITGPALH